MIFAIIIAIIFDTWEKFFQRGSFTFFWMKRFSKIGMVLKKRTLAILIFVWLF